MMEINDPLYMKLQAWPTGAEEPIQILNLRLEQKWPIFV